MNEADEEGSEVASWRWSMVGLGRIGLCLAARCGRLVHSAFRGIAGDHSLRCNINRANLDRFPQFKQVILDAGFHTVVEGLQDSLVKDVRPALHLMWASALFVLLIGCLNVTNLVVAHARARTKELATRLALGAGPARLARQLITESVILTIGSSRLRRLQARSNPEPP